MWAGYTIRQKAGLHLLRGRVHINNLKKSCIICGNSDSVIFEEPSLGLYRCYSCRHVFKNLPKEEQERYGEDYFSDAHKNWFTYPNYRLFAYVRKELTRLKRSRCFSLLDVGCGRGDFLKYLRDNEPGLQLCGVDIADITTPGIRIITGDVMKGCIDGKYDVVATLATIEHVDIPQLFVRRLEELLVPGGLVVVMTDNDGGMMYMIARALRKIGMKAPYEQLYERHHLQCFTKRSLKRLMEQSGFKVISATSHNYPVKAVDMPISNQFMTHIYRYGVRMVFAVSSLFGMGILQTMICRKK